MKTTSYFIIILITIVLLIQLECYNADVSPTEGTSSLIITNPIPIETTSQFTTTSTTNTVTSSSAVTNGIAIGWFGNNSNGWKTSDGASSYDSLNGFQSPNDFCIDEASNTIYVSDMANNRVVKWDISSGNAIAWIGGGANGWNTTNGANPIKDMYGFRLPSGVAIDSSLLYIVDQLNQRICRWDSVSGASQGWIGYDAHGWRYTTVTGGISYTYCGFNTPAKIAVYNSNLYISDGYNNRISVWSIQGTALGCLGGGSTGLQQVSAFSYGTALNSFNKPNGLYIYNNYLYVADSGNNRIVRWNIPTYSGDSWLGGQSSGWQTGNGTGAFSSYDGFAQPGDVFVDSSGVIYVSDSSNHRISKWDSSGNPIGWIGHGSTSSDGWKTIEGGISGNDYKSLNTPSSVYVFNSIIYISDYANHRISKWQN